MKHLLIYALMLASPLSFGQNVDIPDPVLKNRLVSLYDTDDDGEISLNEAETPTDIDLSSIGFFDLTGLEAFVNATNLVLSGNNISDLTPLMHHTSVQSLDLSNNRLKSLPDMTFMSSLLVLRLGSNSLTELPNIRVTRIQILEIMRNEFTEIETAILPPNLAAFDFSVNPVQVFPDLTRLTNLFNCGFSRIDAPFDGTLLPSSLRVIDMEYANVSDWSSFQHLNQLENLFAKACYFSGTLDLTPFSDLRTLDVRENDFTEVTGIEDLTLLEALNLDRNQIESLASLDNLVSLRYLNVKYNQLTTLPDLSILTQLEGLTVSYNQLTELPQLPPNGALYNIECDGNLLTSLPDLSGLPRLYSLSAARNQLTDLVNVVIPDTVRRLDLGYNQLVMPPMLSAPNEDALHVQLDWNLLSTMAGLPQSPNIMYSARHNFLVETSCPWFTNTFSSAYEKQGHVGYGDWLTDSLTVKNMVSVVNQGYSAQTYTISCD